MTSTTQLLGFAASANAPCATSARAEADWDGVREQIFRIAYSLTLDYSRAEDLAQEALVRAWRYRIQYEAATHPRAWLARIVVNRAKSAWRRDRLWLFANHAEQTSVPEDPNLLALRCAVETLDETHRTVVLLVGVYGFTYEEVAETLKIPAGTVGSRFHQAKRSLKAILEEGR